MNGVVSKSAMDKREFGMSGKDQKSKIPKQGQTENQPDGIMIVKLANTVCPQQVGVAAFSSGLDGLKRVRQIGILSPRPHAGIH